MSDAPFDPLAPVDELRRKIEEKVDDLDERLAVEERRLAAEMRARRRSVVDDTSSYDESSHHEGRLKNTDSA